MNETVPMGDTIETALDRMKRAGNFASNCAYMAEHDGITTDQIGVYIRAARAMLDEAERTLGALAQ